MSGMAPMMVLWLVEVKEKADDVGDSKIECINKSSNDHKK